MKVQSISGRKVCTFRRKPTAPEALELERTASVARYLYNWGLACCQVQLRRAQRHLSRARRGSRNRQKARRRVGQIQERTAKLRQEFLHQLSYLIVMTWSVICFGDLSESGRSEDRRRGRPGDGKRLSTASQSGGSQRRRLKQ